MSGCQYFQYKITPFWFVFYVIRDQKQRNVYMINSLKQNMKGVVVAP